MIYLKCWVICVYLMIYVQMNPCGAHDENSYPFYNWRKLVD